jgi:acyl-CoA thioesterase-1
MRSFAFHGRVGPTAGDRKDDISVQRHSEDLRICFIGDSFVAGVGDETALGWTGRLLARSAEAGRPATGYNLGIRRNTSTDIRARLRDEEHNLRILLLNNDFRDICDARGCTFVDVFTALEKHDVWRRQVRDGDGAHPRSGGYTALFELVAPAWDEWLRR